MDGMKTLGKVLLPIYWLTAILAMLGGVAALAFGAISGSWPAVAAGAVAFLYGRELPHLALGMAKGQNAASSLERAVAQMGANLDAARGKKPH